MCSVHVRVCRSKAMGACCKATLGQHHKGLHIAHFGCVRQVHMVISMKFLGMAPQIWSCKYTRSTRMQLCMCEHTHHFNLPFTMSFIQGEAVRMNTNQPIYLTDSANSKYTDMPPYAGEGQVTASICR